MLDNKIGVSTDKSADFCMTGDRFLLADFTGRQNQSTLSIARHPLK